MPQNEAKRINHKQMGHILVELFKRKVDNDKPVYTVAISKYIFLLKKWKFKKVQEVPTERGAYQLYNYSIKIYEDHFAANPKTVKTAPKVH